MTTKDKDCVGIPSRIYDVLLEEHQPDEKIAAFHAMRIGGELAKAVVRGEDRPRTKGEYWASDLGKDCMRQQWFNFNQPELKEPLLGHTKFKFLYGNILEEAGLYLAKEAGDDVSHEQERVETTFHTDGHEIKVSGKIDALINNRIVDVKSTSSYGFKKVKDSGCTAENDSFGYLWQLGFYNAYADFEGVDPDGCGFLWIDKQNGTLLYDDCSSEVPSPSDIRERAVQIHHNVMQTSPPKVRPKAATPEAYGKSGNMKLPIKCAYCPFKHPCWQEDANGGRGLRGFYMSHGPVWMTEVKREPRVPEITTTTAVE